LTNTRVWLLVACLTGAQEASADYLDGRGEAPYEPCGYCHEFDGNPRMPAYPRLAGQRRPYIVKQLQDFRAGNRQGPMQGTAELLTDDDIQAVADYFSLQQVRTAEMAPQSAQARQVAETLFERGDPARGLSACQTCHGSDGLGRGMVPRLAGQHNEYLLEQLSLFRAAQRSNDPGGQMRSIAASLTEPEIDALAGYLARMRVRSR